MGSYHATSRHHKIQVLWAAACAHLRSSSCPPRQIRDRCPRAGQRRFRRCPAASGLLPGAVWRLRYPGDGSRRPGLSELPHLRRDRIAFPRGRTWSTGSSEAFFAPDRHLSPVWEVQVPRVPCRTLWRSGLTQGLAKFLPPVNVANPQICLAVLAPLLAQGSTEHPGACRQQRRPNARDHCGHSGRAGRGSGSCAPCFRGLCPPLVKNRFGRRPPGVPIGVMPHCENSTRIQ